MNPQKQVDCSWTPIMSYVLGLIATDGNLSPSGRHIYFTSKDFELAELFHTYLGLKVKIGVKSRAKNEIKKYHVVQFGDVNFYRFLISIGLTKNKSKTIGSLRVPRKFFMDFLRGCIDGDGNIGIFMHPESKHPQLRVRLFSASKKFLEWIEQQVERYGIHGFFTKSLGVHVLVFAKADSTKLLNLIYYAGFPKSLERKYQVAVKYAGVA